MAEGGEEVREKKAEGAGEAGEAGGEKRLASPQMTNDQPQSKEIRIFT